MSNKQFLKIEVHSIKSVLLFLLLFILMQQVWLNLATTQVGQWWINQAITQSLALAIQMLYSENITVDGSRVVGLHGGINIANGCDGMDVMLMLLAALITSRLTIKQKGFGALLGLLFLFSINQIRLIIMFFASQYQRDIFVFIHGIFAPLIMLGATGIFYAWWLSFSTTLFPEDVGSQ